MRRCFSLLVLLLAGFPLQAATPTEQYVESKAAAGEVADVSGFSDRNISAAFLESLLTRKTGVHRHGIQIVSAVFPEALDLRNVEVPWPVALRECRFQGYVDISGAQFHSNVNFDGSVFSGDLNASSMKVAGSFSAGYFPANSASRIQCGSSVAERGQLATFNRAANFNSASIGGHAFFRYTRFRGTAEFIQTRIGGELAVCGSTFEYIDPQNKNVEVSFNGAIVGGTVFLNDAVFRGGVNLATLSTQNNLEADNVRFENKSRIAEFGDLKAVRGLIIRNATFEGQVDFSEIDVGTLTIREGKWPEDKSLRCSDLKFSSLYFPGKLSALDWAAKARYSPALYTKFARFYEDHGDPQLASDFRIEKRKRDRPLLNAFDWCLNWLSYLIADYGEEPWLSLIYIAIVVAFGSRVFGNENNMQETDPGTGKPRPAYNPLWYSLGLLLPVVELGNVKQWKPKGNGFRFHYSQVHVLLGWIFVPVLIAAGAGLLR